MARITNSPKPCFPTESREYDSLAATSRWIYLSGTSDICLWKRHQALLQLTYSTPNFLVHVQISVEGDVGSASTYLKVSEYVQADPVAVRVCDEAQAHVGSGVVEVTDQIHRLRTAFGAQHAI